MSEAREFNPTESLPNNYDFTENPVTKKERAFYSGLESFPQSSQELIASLSSTFLEEDIYNKFKKNKGSVSALRKRFRAQGLTQEQIHQVFDFFALPYQQSPIKNADNK